MYNKNISEKQEISGKKGLLFSQCLCILKEQKVYWEGKNIIKNLERRYEVDY